MDEMNPQTENTAPTAAVEASEVVASSDADATKWYELNSQKKKVAAGIGAGVLAFGFGFGAAAMFTGDDHGDRDHRGAQMQQWMDGQQMPMQGQMGPGRGDMQRGGQQWGQQGGPQMPMHGQMPSMGPNSGGPSRSNGS